LSSWLEFSPPANSIDPWSPTSLSNSSCPPTGGLHTPQVRLMWSHRSSAYVVSPAPLVHLKLSHGQFVHRLVSNLSPYLFIANATGLGLSASSSFWSLMWSDMVLRTKAAVQGDPPLAEAHLTNVSKTHIGPLTWPKYSAWTRKVPSSCGAETVHP